VDRNYGVENAYNDESFKIIHLAVYWLDIRSAEILSWSDSWRGKLVEGLHIFFKNIQYHK
jgi:hypothetical protein